MEGLPTDSAARGSDDRKGRVLTGGRRIVLWRHGQTIWNVEHRFQGGTDIALDDLGRVQAKNSAARLAALRPALIMSSDLSRAADTAGELAALTGLTVSTDPRLRERSGGEWEGLTGVEIRARYPEAWAVWEPVGGEASPAVGQRMVEMLREVAERLADGETAVIASHGGAIRAGLAALLELPEMLWSRLGPLANCSWSVVGEAPEGWALRGWRLLEHNAGTLPEPVLSDDR